MTDPLVLNLVHPPGRGKSDPRKIVFNVWVSEESMQAYTQHKQACEVLGEDLAHVLHYHLQHPDE